MLTQTFNISLPKQLVQQVDIVAQKEFKNRSELIKDALRNYLIDKQSWDEIFAYGKSVGKRMKIKSEEQVFEMLYKDKNATSSN